MERGCWGFLLRGALGASLGGAMWYVSLPLAGTHVIALMLYPFNFMAVAMLLLLFVAPLASAVGAAGAWVIWLLDRKRRTGMNALLRVMIATAVATAVGAPLAILLIPRSYSLTPAGLLGYRLLFGVLTGALAGWAAGSKVIREASRW